VTDIPPGFVKVTVRLARRSVEDTDIVERSFEQVVPVNMEDKTATAAIARLKAWFDRGMK
jgi:hypothetical protein